MVDVQPALKRALSRSLETSLPVVLELHAVASRKKTISARTNGIVDIVMAAPQSTARASRISSRFEERRQN